MHQLPLLSPRYGVDSAGHENRSEGRPPQNGVTQLPVLTQPGLGMTTTTVTTVTQTGGDWSTGLFDVCSDGGTCVMGALVPCCVELSLAHQLGECIWLPLLPGSTFAMRVGFRERFKIRETQSEPFTAEETMEEPQWNQGTELEAKPRKVRFKLASSYSGRVLKHVYEDGQELESPGETYPHSFVPAELPQLGNFKEEQGLLAQRINVYRGTGSHETAGFHGLRDGADKEPVLDFGKIIIYTSNLKIIRCPQRKGESCRSQRRCRGEGGESSPGRDCRSKGRHRARSGRPEEHSPTLKQKAPMKEEVGGCEHCGGVGSAPCSLCHGSKLSMLANRFNESIRELRCPACDAHGLERCHSCGK